MNQGATFCRVNQHQRNFGLRWVMIHKAHLIDIGVVSTEAHAHFFSRGVNLVFYLYYNSDLGGQAPV